jgi:hypothetical protein
MRDDAVDDTSSFFSDSFCNDAMIVGLDYLLFVTSAALNVCALSQLAATQG